MFPFVVACCSLGGGGGLSSFVAPDMQGARPSTFGGRGLLFSSTVFTILCVFMCVFFVWGMGGGVHNYQIVHYSLSSCMVQKYYS